MPRLRTLADIRTQVRRRADTENTQFVTDAEIDQYIQDSWGEFYDLLLEAAGSEHFAQLTWSTPGSKGFPFIDAGGEALTTYGTQFDLSGSFTPPPVTVTPPFPHLTLSVYKILSVHWSTQTALEGTWHRLRPDPRPGSIHLGPMGPPETYRVMGPFPGPNYANGYTDHARKILISPTPDQRYYFQIMYVPSPPDLRTAAVPVTQASDAFTTHNLQSYTGWDEYVVCDAAAKCLEKEESFAAADRLLLRKAQAGQRIKWHAQTMNADGAGRMRDIDTEQTLGEWDWVG